MAAAFEDYGAVPRLGGRASGHAPTPLYVPPPYGSAVTSHQGSGAARSRTPGFPGGPGPAFGTVGPGALPSAPVPPPGRKVAAPSPYAALLLQAMTVSRKPVFLVSWFMPFAAFLVNLLLFAYAFMAAPGACWVIAATMLAAGAALGVAPGSWHRAGGAPAWRPASGAAVAAGVVAGAAVGLYVHDGYVCFTAFYRNSRLYTGMVPSQPSAAVADAGRIIFTNEAFVDTNKSSAFVSEAGAVYCAAPVLDKGNPSSVEFWAVGVECCTPASFSCDSAQDPAAHAGIRIFDNSGWFTDSRKDFYRLARLKAEATHSLLSVDSPLYVRWVGESNLDMLAQYYSSQGAFACVGAAFMWLAASGLFSFALHREVPAAK